MQTEKLNIWPFTPWAIIWVPVTERHGGLFPFLILQNGKPSLIAAYYAKWISEAGWSDAKIEKHLRTIGKFYAFCLSKYPNNSIPESKIYNLFGEFAESRFRGTINIHGIDQSGLYWIRVLYKTVRMEIKCLNKFSNFTSHYFNAPSLNPEDKQLDLSLKHYKNLRDQGLSDALVHLDGVRNAKTKQLFEFSTRIIQKVSRPKYINTVDLIKLIDEGCHSARDKMLLLLMGFGGLRISEPLHLYVSDVMNHFPYTQASKIVLSHPSEGHFSWRDKNKVHKGKRSDYLKTEFSLLPRNELGGGHKNFSGWKGMDLVHAEPNDNYIYWLAEEHTGSYFRKLLEQYIEENKSLFVHNRLEHPYLFFNTKKRSDTYGQMMTLANVHQVFYNACKRTNIDSHPHLTRHHYGFYVRDILNLRAEDLKALLKHKAITSSQKYFHKDASSVRNSILENLSPSTINHSCEKTVIFPAHWSYF
ncbi:MAG: hypothetical protein V4493_04745 [Pseudomonadota bacterium]